MVHAPVGQHHFIQSFLPALIGVLLSSALLLLGVGAIMDRHLEHLARGMAQKVAPGAHAQLALDLAVGDLALASAIAATVGDERVMDEARDRLDSAARAYDGWAHAAHVGIVTDATPAVAHYEERVELARARSDYDEQEVHAAAEQMSDVLRINSNAAANESLRTLQDIIACQQRRRWIEVTVMALLAGSCIALMFAARRREERACAEEVAVVTRLEQANADLEAFAGRVAHDLRNPLVPILSGSQVIERSEVSAQVRRAAERIERSARRLSSMIDMLLDYSRLAAAPSPGRCDVHTVVEDVVEGFRDQARADGIRLEIESEVVDAACEPIVLASPLQNLIENAFKYGQRPEAEPVIEVRAFLRAGMVIVEVEDRGPGISPTAAEHLFLAFQRGVDGGQGVGLGLATARRLVESRGGSIGLRTGSFGGALFQIRLPAAPPEVVAAAEAEPLPSA